MISKRFNFLRPLTAALILFVFCGFANAQNKIAPQQFYAHLERGETEPVFKLMAQLFEQNGASVWLGSGEFALDLELKNFDEQINDFSQAQIKISLGRMMTEAESRLYWDKWSKTLTGNGWRQDEFFKNERERLLLANYNVLVLMAHEYGHYFDLRYEALPKSGGFAGLVSDAPINCQEYFADNFAVAVMNYLAKDENFAVLKKRYAELLKSLDGKIPARNRIKIASVAQLETNCGAIKLESNGVEIDGSINVKSFQKYVSAYFNRYLAMLARKDFPTLSALTARKLNQPFYSRFKFTTDKVSVKTVSAVSHVFSPACGDLQFLSLDFMKEETTFVSALNDKGEIRQFEVLPNAAEKDWQAFDIKIFDDQKNQIDARQIRLPRETDEKLGFGNVALFSDTDFWLVFYPARRKDASKPFAWLVEYSRSGGRWNVTTRKFDSYPIPLYDCNQHWLVTPGGKLFMISADKTGAELYEINRADLSVRLQKSLYKGDFDKKYPMSRFRFFADDDGRVFFIEDHLYYGARGIGELTDGLPFLVKNVSGEDDGENKRQIRFAHIQGARFISPGLIRVADYAGDGKTVLREITIH